MLARRDGSSASTENVRVMSVSFYHHSSVTDFDSDCCHNHAGCKHTNFELAAHAPLIIKVPGLTDGGIRECDTLAYFHLQSRSAI